MIPVAGLLTWHGPRPVPAATEPLPVEQTRPRPTAVLLGHDPCRPPVPTMIRKASGRARLAILPCRSPTRKQSRRDRRAGKTGREDNLPLHPATIFQRHPPSRPNLRLPGGAAPLPRDPLGRCPAPTHPRRRRDRRTERRTRRSPVTRIRSSRPRANRRPRVHRPPSPRIASETPVSGRPVRA